MIAIPSTPSPSVQSSAAGGLRPPRAPTGGTNTVATEMNDPLDGKHVPDVVISLFRLGWVRVPIGDNTIAWIPPESNGEGT